MAWDDPSPRARARSSPPGSQPSPGYAEPGLPLSRRLLLLAAAVVVGTIVYVVARIGIASWHGTHAVRSSSLDTLLALALATLGGALQFRYLSRRPAYGLSARIRDGGGWFGRNRSWDDRYGNGYSSSDLVAVDLTADLVSLVIDIASD